MTERETLDLYSLVAQYNDLIHHQALSLEVNVRRGALSSPCWLQCDSNIEWS